ncbi:probable glycosidase CRH2 [Monosporozyma servazzii]
MNRLLYIFSLFLVLLRPILAEEIHYCNATISCPDKYPCCSQSGQCGTGNYCLGNCDPRYSFTLDSCMPAPLCKNINTRFSKYSDKIVNANTFLGNASEADWTYTGYIMDYEDDDALILAMPKNSGGTVLASTHSIWYGKVSAVLKTSHLAGVITSFILYSGVQDEIDFEWVGADIDMTQTNFYWNGVLDWHNSANISTSDTYNNFHTYEIDWQEDYITWSVDGVIGRTLLKNDTYNSTSGRYEFPQTPSKVDLSIWPGGNATNAEGTVAWAGGEIDWDAPEIKDPGYYYAVVKEVNITCNDIPSGTKRNGTRSYIYNNEDEFLAKDVSVVDKRIDLGSLFGSGDHPDAGVTKSSSSSSKKTSSTTKSSSSSSSSSSKKGKKGKGKKTATTTTTSSSSSSTTTSYTAAKQVSTKIEVTYVTSARPHSSIVNANVKATSDNSGSNNNIHSRFMIIVTLLFNLFV